METVAEGHRLESSGRTSGNKRFKRFVVAMAVLFTVLLVGALIYDQRGRAELDRAIAEARADGQALTLADIEQMRMPCPEEQNGAAVIQALAARLESIAKDEEVKVLPTFSDADKKLAELPLGQLWPASVDEQVARQLTRFSSELTQIDRLRGFEHGRFAFPYKRNPATGMSWPSEGAFLANKAVETAVRLKTLEVMSRAVHGQTTRFTEDMAVLLSFGRILEKEPMLMDSMIGVAADAAAVTALEEVCAHNILTVEQLSVLMDQLCAADARNLLLAGSVGERALRLERANVSGLNASDTGRSPPLVSRILWGLPGARGWMFRFQAVIVCTQNRFVAAAMHPGNTMLEHRAIIGAKPDVSECVDRVRAAAFISDRLFELNACSKAVLRSALLGLAAERYRIEKGVLPAKPEDLVPAYVSAIPRDPYDGQPLRYRSTEQGVVIYALGENMVDDNGQVRPSADKRGPDVGFSLLEPSLRCRAPASQPTSIPASDQDRM